MQKRRKLQRDLKRYRALLPLTSDREAIAALQELIRETRDRLNELDPVGNRNAESGC